MEDHQNIFDKAVLIQISSSCWQGVLQLPARAMAEIGDSDWLKGRKHLVDPEYLTKVRSTSVLARSAIKKYTLPFPLTGMMMVPKESIARIEEDLKKIEEKFWNEVETFIEIYDTAREEARDKLGEYYSETDYPQNIRSKFALVWRYVMVSTPGVNSLLSPELYAQERNKFVEMMDEARRDATAALRQEFAEFVSSIVEKLQPDADGKKKHFKNTTFNRFNEFLEMFKNRNLFQDNQLESLVDKAKALMENLDPDLLRDDGQSNLKAHIRNEMSKMAAEVESFIVDVPRRKIVLPKAA